MINSKKNNPTLNRKTRKAIELFQRKYSKRIVPLDKYFRPIVSNTIVFASTKDVNGFLAKYSYSASDLIVDGLNVKLKKNIYRYGTALLYFHNGTDDISQYPYVPEGMTGIIRFDGVFMAMPSWKPKHNVGRGQTLCYTIWDNDDTLVYVR